MSLRPHYSFLQQLAWQTQAQNALQYNTSQPGSVIPVVIGTLRVPSNLIGFGGYAGPTGGSKGKGGPLPIGGTNTVAGKGGLSSGQGKKGGKKATDYTIDVAFGVCQGPVEQYGLAFVNASVAAFSSVDLNFYAGVDGQAPDGTFVGLGQVVGYSGTSYFTGTPMDLGMSPVLPNVGVEVYAILQSTFPGLPDANAGMAVQTVLTDERWGAEFPAANLDPNLLTTYGDYTVAAGLPVSFSMDAQQKCTEWLDGLAKLTNSAIVCSAALVKLIPYGDLALTANGVTWTPNLTPLASFDDDDFLPWHPRGEEDDPQLGEDDPVLFTRTNPADRDNWLTIQFKDRANFYNDNVVPVFDQGAIDLYGRRDGETLPGKCFTAPGPAQISAQLFLQRRIYMPGTVRFKGGWQHSLWEPMDVVLLTDPGIDFYQTAVRIISRRRDKNGDLTFEAELIPQGAAPPPPPPPVPAVVYSAGALGPTSITSPPVVTTQTNNVLVVFVTLLQCPAVPAGLAIPGVTEIVSTSGLGWQQRGASVVLTDGSLTMVMEEWWAPAPAALAGEAITATITMGGVCAATMGVIAQAVADPDAPFDPNPALPVFATSTAGTVPSIPPFNTSGSNDLAIGYASGNVGPALQSSSTPTTPVNWGVGMINAQAYQVFDGVSLTSAAAGVFVPYAGSAAPNLNGALAQNMWIMIGDALTGVTT